MRPKGKLRKRTERWYIEGRRKKEKGVQHILYAFSERSVDRPRKTGGKKAEIREIGESWSRICVYTWGRSFSPKKNE